MNEENNVLILDWTPESMLEVSLEAPDDFLKVKETLTRIGVASTRDGNVLFQSCHILHKQGRYFIVHFKELFLLDGRPANFFVEDRARRNTIAQLLSDWGLLDILSPDSIKETSGLKNIKIIPFKEKSAWVLRPKYTIGKRKSSTT
jgi:hypothetical protein